MDGLSITIDDKATRAWLKGYESQLPFVTALALTRTAQAAQVAVKQEMVRVFDRPTPFAINSTFVKPATKTKPEALLFFKDLGNKGGGDARTRYAPQVFGGERLFKRFEGALFRAGLLGRNEVAVPGEGATLDAYGNISRGQIVDILSWFQAFGEQGFRANSTKETRAKRYKGTKSKRGYRYFYSRDKHRGIWMAVPTAFGDVIKPVLMFVKRAKYKRLLDVGGVVDRTVATQYAAWFDDAVREAIRTAR
jgi:hypothetical protein